MRLLVGERHERYELPFGRRAIYIRPAVHPDPDAPAEARRLKITRVATLLAVTLVIAAVIVLVRL